MKIAAYEVRPDEKPVIEGLCKKYGIELISTPANLDKTTANMAAGCDGVTTLGQSDYCNAVLDELKGYGVKVLASRCVGYNHMNCDYARSLGFRLCNGAYAPNGVAEYTVMAILMCIRKFKKALYNTNDNDFTLKGKIVFGIGLGIITSAIRFWGNMAEGVSFAILLMNLLVPYIEVNTRQDKLGIAKVKKGGAAK